MIQCDECGIKINLRCVLFKDKNIGEKQKQELYKLIVKRLHKCKKTKLTNEI